jgi:hypothetical protein
MKKEVNKFSVITELYSNFTEDNKENLYKTAQNLLKVQKKDAETLAATSKKVRRKWFL